MSPIAVSASMLMVDRDHIRCATALADAATVRVNT
jgi:hypothetical protein